MKASPVHCEHGRIVCWDISDALPDDPLPEIPGCPDCDEIQWYDYDAEERAAVDRLTATEETTT